MPDDSQENFYCNLDFLSEQSVVLTNLKPDGNGVIKVDRKLLLATQPPQPLLLLPPPSSSSLLLSLSSSAASYLRVIAIDDDQVVLRSVSLPERPPKFSDLRLLRNALSPSEHYSEQKDIAIINEEGRSIEIGDITTSTLELYETLAKVYRLLSTLSSDNATTLLDFGFVLRWNTMSFEEKCSLHFSCLHIHLVQTIVVFGRSENLFAFRIHIKIHKFFI